MLRVPLNQAWPGMRLAMAIVNPRRGHVLLTPGFILDEAMIRKLRDLQVREVWAEFPGTEEIKAFVSPGVIEQQGRLINVMAECFDAVHGQAHAKIEVGCYRTLVRDLIEELAADPAAGTYILEMGGSNQSDLRHCSEVCFLSVLLGLHLGDYLVRQRRRLPPTQARNVLSLGLGALLHDVGYLQIDPEARDRYHRTRDESDPQWREHVHIGHRLVSGSIRPAAAGVVLQHHQYFDGSGFPVMPDERGNERGLSGEEIHVFARIVCVANHFDRLRHLSDGTVRPRLLVLREMLSPRLRGRFDPVILAALPRVAPVFPPGSQVRLSDGRRGVVVDWDADCPLQPIVQIVSEEALCGRTPAAPGGAEDATRIDLRQNRSLSIVEHDGMDVSDAAFRKAVA